jgi:hypothetical protein
MSKADHGRITPQSEHPENAQRSRAYLKVAKRYRQFYRDGQTDDQRDATCRAFYNSISDYLAVADRIAPAQQVRDIPVRIQQIHMPRPNRNPPTGFKC